MSADRIAVVAGTLEMCDVGDVVEAVALVRREGGQTALGVELIS